MFSQSFIRSILVLLYLSECEPRHVAPARELAPAVGTSSDALVKVLTPLIRGGLLCTHPGRFGGFALTLPTREITLLRVVEAVDGPLGVRDLTPTVSGPAEVLRLIRSTQQEAVQRLRAYLSK